ncbi:MAG: TAXI family TRAP transporter solute-binding subunit [Reyranellaceae bacterium]
MRRAVLALMLLLAVSACGRGPKVEQVQRDLAERLTQVFGEGALEIAAIRGQGSSPDVAAPSGEERRVVYYDARLRVARDISFGGWNTAGVASLVNVLGAGPKGVTGTRTPANSAGDEIKAHGTAIYRRDGDNWRLVASAAFEAPVAPALDNISAPNTADTLLAALNNVVKASPAHISPVEQEVINQELSRALAVIQSRLSRLAQGYPIAAGPEGGQYVRFVQALQSTKAGGLDFHALITPGSVENVNLLRQNQAPLAIIQSDIAEQAQVGTGVFAKQGSFAELRALGSLYPEFVHIIVRADSPARDIRDLVTRRISIGPVGSGTRETAERLLRAHGMESGRDYKAESLSLPQALTALNAGNIDAVVQVIGAPADQIRLAAAAAPIKLLAVDEAILGSLTAGSPSLLRGVVARGTYRGVDQDVATLSVTALVATTATALSEPEVRRLIAAIFGGKPDLVAAGSVQAGQVSPATARAGLPIALAIGADAALAELGARK